MNPSTTDAPLRAPTHTGRGRWVIVLAAVLAALMLIAGCSEDTSIPPAALGKDLGAVESTAKPVPGGKIVVGIIAETNSLSPAAGLWTGSGLEEAHALFDTLAAFGADGKAHPDLAVAFDHDPVWRTWTVTLRQGVTFHNGASADAEALARNWDYLQKYPTTHKAFGLIDHYTPTGPPDAQGRHWQMTVTMNRPWTGFVEAMATQIGVFAEPGWLESGDGLNPVGTGAFVLDHWTPGKELVVKRNPHYWRRSAAGDQMPYLDQIEFRPIADDIQRKNALLAGDVQLIELGDPEVIASFADAAARNEAQVFDKLVGETQEAFVQLNTQTPVFTFDPARCSPPEDGGPRPVECDGDGLDARRAMSYAIDRGDLVDSLYGGAFKPAAGPYSPESKWYDPQAADLYPHFDMAKAKQLSAKVKARQHGFKVNLLVPSDNPGLERTAQWMLAKWEEAGIDVHLQSVEPATMLIQVVTGQWDPAHTPVPYQAAMFFQFDAPDPGLDAVWWSPKNTPPSVSASRDEWLAYARDQDPKDRIANPERLTKDQLMEKLGTFGLNFSRNKDDRMEALLNDALGNPDPAVVLDDYRRVQRLIAVDNPYVWEYHTQLVKVADPELVNVINWVLPDGSPGMATMQGFTPLSQVWIKHSA